jgi:RNA polymerase sigma factor (sigma-70 family)
MFDGKMTENHDFKSLMQLISEGSEDAAWELVQEYGEFIRRAVRRVINHRLRSKFDSLDFVQLVWSSFFRTRNKLDRFERPEELAAFLITMARNKVGMEVRRRIQTEKYNINRECSFENSSMSLCQLSAHDPQPIDVAIAREQWNCILSGQPENYRKIISLRLQGLSYQDIADSLHVDESTVRRFLKKLFIAKVA